MERRCRECGEGVVRPLANAGRMTSYRTLAQLAVPADLEVPTCTNCGTEWIDRASAARIDERLEQVYREELRGRAVRALAVLGDFIQQTHLERILGLSHG